MPTDKIHSLLDEAAALGFDGPVGFHHYSEPLLDDRHLELARAATERGMKPDLHTNGDALLDDDALCLEVTRAYEMIVVGLYDFRTQDELDAAKRFWRSRLSGARLAFSPIGNQGANSGESVGVPRAGVPANPRMAIRDLTYPNAPCHRPLIRMIIQHDGEVCQCCDDTTGAFGLGNVYENSLENLWYSDGHVSTVSALIEGKRDEYVLCASCPMSPTGPRPDGAAIDIAFRPPAADGSSRDTGVTP
jgi:radical SAM protein with 4Fe4S-binding SPASM domain